MGVPWQARGGVTFHYCTANDLRRTFAQWMRQAGAPLELVAPMMGHATTKMLELVYGRLDAASLSQRLHSVLRPTGAPPENENAADRADSTTPSALAATGTSGHENRGETELRESGPSGDRTLDQRIKSPLLYRLS
jgi:hypothetical protein